MTRQLRFLFFAALCAVCFVPSAWAQINILSPADAVVPFDFDGDEITSSSPGAEEAWLAFDGSDDTKYLNFAREDSGIIITPRNGPVAIQSFLVITANDAPERDPISWQIWGTNDPVVDTHHGDGNQTPWTLIAEGDDTGLSEDPGRFNVGADPIQSFENTTEYSSYRFGFPTVRADNANSVQIAEIEFFADQAATIAATTNVRFSADDPNAMPECPDPCDVTNTNVLAYAPIRVTNSESASPGGEPASAAIDGDAATKYLNFGKENSGFIVTPAGGPATFNSVRFTSANDAVPRDPLAFDIYGTNDPITSAEHGNGDEEDWTLLGSGRTGLEDLPLNLDGEPERNFQGEIVPFGGVDEAFSSYRLVFTELADSANANSVQVSEIEFLQTDGIVIGPGPGLGCDLDGDGVCDSADLDLLYAQGGDIAEWLTQASADDGLGTVNEHVLGDANLDGNVDSTDLGLLLNNFNGAGGPAATWSGGDLNNSGNVDSTDLGLLLNNFNFTSASASAVPEPNSAVLILLGVFGLLARRRK